MKLPKVIFVRFERDPNADVEYLAAFETVAEGIEDDGPTTFGVYELREKTVARKKVEQYKPRKHR